MKKISLFVAALALFAACQNDPTPASTATPVTGTTAPAQGDMEKGKANAIAQHKALSDLITDLDAMPADFRNKPEVQSIRSTMGDISGKAEMMMQAINGEVVTAKEGVSDQMVSTAPSMEESVAGLQRYSDEINAARGKFDQLAAAHKAAN